MIDDQLLEAIIGPMSAAFNNPDDDGDYSDDDIDYVDDGDDDLDCDDDDLDSDWDDDDDMN